MSMGFSCLYAALIVLHRRRVGARDLALSLYPKVSIFLTLRNIDDGLEENLASVFSLDYPDYDVYFAVDNLEDPCVDVLERVRARFPHIRSFVVAAGHSLVNNPKVK